MLAKIRSFFAPMLRSEVGAVGVGPVISIVVGVIVLVSVIGAAWPEMTTTLDDTFGTGGTLETSPAGPIFLLLGGIGLLGIAGAVLLGFFRSIGFGRRG